MHSHFILHPSEFWLWLELKRKQKYLTIKSTFLNGNDTKVYKKVPFDTPLYISLKRASKRAKKNYEQYYKKHVDATSNN